MRAPLGFLIAGVIAAILMLICDGCYFDVPEGMIGGIEREYHETGLDHSMTHWEVFTVGSHRRHDLFESPKFIPEQVAYTEEIGYTVVYSSDCTCGLYFEQITFRIGEEASRIFWEMDEVETLIAGGEVLNLVLQELVDQEVITSFHSMRQPQTVARIKEEFDQSEEAQGLILILNTADARRNEPVNGTRFSGSASVDGCFPNGGPVYYGPCAICF